MYPDNLNYNGLFHGMIRMIMKLRNFNDLKPVKGVLLYNTDITCKAILNSIQLVINSYDKYK